MNLSLHTRYALFGVLFGLLFSITGTAVELSALHIEIGIANVIALHARTPLLWIIDTAPIVLGFCGWMVARAQLLNQAGHVAENVDLKANLAGQVEAIERSAAVLELNPEGIIIKVNPIFCQIVGYAEHELLGKEYQLLQPVHAIDPELDWHRAAAGQVVQGEFQQVGKGGREVWISGSFTPVRNEAGRVERIIKIAFDLSELKRAEASLRQHSRDLEISNRELDKFSYMVSHHLKSPLRAISSLATWTKEELGESVSADASKYLALIESRTKRMHDLITGLLDYSKLSPASLVPEPVNLFEVIGEVLESMNVPESFSFDITDNIPDQIYVKRLLVSQVFFHAFDNAIRHHHDGQGVITIGMRQVDNRYQFSVADNGPGIDPAFHEKVFEMFQTLLPRDEMENTGIGLTMVRKLVEAEGGRVWLDSNLGNGTTLLWELPVLAVALQTEENPVEPVAVMQ